jgi:hypothetical protein
VAEFHGEAGRREEERENWKTAEIRNGEKKKRRLGERETGETRKTAERGNGRKRKRQKEMRDAR